MTIDKSLKIKAGSTKSRNVLTRPERLAKLMELERWKDGDAIYGLPKVRVQKISLKKKKKVKKEDEEGGVAPAAAAPKAKGAKK
jgi:small basic protein (TIGR04137 family)